MDAFTGEIRPFGFNYNPIDWMLCNGQTLPIQQYSALYAVIGIRYGGNGTTNFKLPNIPGTVLNGAGQLAGGSTYEVGETGGTEGVQLITNEMPAHTHTFNAGNTLPATAINKEISSPGGSPLMSFISNSYEKIPAARAGFSYTSGAPNATLSPQSVSIFGGGQGHNNMQPSQVINYCICVNGYFPPRP